MSFAEIKKAVNSNLNVPLNEQQRIEIFTENGTFVVPKRVNRILVSACAAGNDGSSGTHNASSGGGFIYGGVGGAGGTAGQSVLNMPLCVSAGESIDIIVGEGNTIIKNIILLKGASSPGISGTGGGTMEKGSPGLGSQKNGEQVFIGAAGISGATKGEHVKTGGGGGGGGGSSLFGKGGDGGQGGTEVSPSYGGGAPPQPQQQGKHGTGYGSGGGGGGGGAGCYAGSTSYIGGTIGGKGGKGAPGIVIIEW